LPTYNRGKLAKVCVESILQQSFKDFELIVINDGSHDETQNVLAEIEDDRITVYQNLQNEGLPRSRNKAMNLAKTDYIMFVEDDITLEPTSLERLYKTTQLLEEKGIRVGAVGPRLIRDSKDTRHRGGRVVEIDRFTGMVFTDFGTRARFIQEVPTLHACSMIRKSVFLEVGGYDSDRFSGTSFREETDFYFRVRRAGYRLFFEPHAIAVHKPAAIGGSRKSRLRTDYYGIRNHILFLSRFYGLKAFPMTVCYVGYFVLVHKAISEPKTKLFSGRETSFLATGRRCENCQV
jgi:GT2 family glycosyltransferase